MVSLPNRHVIPNPSRRGCRLSNGRLLRRLLSKKPARHGRRLVAQSCRPHYHFRRSEAPEVGSGRDGPVASSRPNRGRGDDVFLLNNAVLGVSVVLLSGAPEAFTEEEGGETGLVVGSGGGGSNAGGAVVVRVRGERVR
uniref:Uncharacterized protein n=1 Tax=Opuntia streptacantha TaxID=393608 RepID=A0A7C8ZW40_OPUST